MAYVCESPRSWEGSTVGSGECVAFVQQTANAPTTSYWRSGRKVKDDRFLRSGTAIATFDASGHYPNHATGNHAAVFDSHDLGGKGIWVFDQWHGQPVHKRLIRYGGHGASNDADRFFIIE